MIPSTLVWTWSKNIWRKINHLILNLLLVLEKSLVFTLWNDYEVISEIMFIGHFCQFRFTNKMYYNARFLTLYHIWTLWVTIFILTTRY